jgi:hypothetical protein
LPLLKHGALGMQVLPGAKEHAGTFPVFALPGDIDRMICSVALII